MFFKETAMGVSINAQINSDSAYVNSVKEINKIVLWRDTTVVGKNDFTYRFTENYKKALKCVEVLQSFTNNVIKKRKAELEGNTQKEEKNDEFGIKKRRSFLDLLLHDSDGNNVLRRRHQTRSGYFYVWSKHQIDKN